MARNVVLNCGWLPTYLACVILASASGCSGDGGGSGLCVALGGAISSDTTLDASCYEVDSHLYVGDGAVLTIMPGVTLRFAQGVGLTISSDGRLSAAGTAEDPIVLTGAESTRGFWDGVYVDQSNSATNRLEHVTIEYGGGDNDANLVMYGTSGSPARLAVLSCTLRESAEFGFYFNDHAIPGEFSDNTMTANTSAAGYTTANVTGYLDDGSSYAGNDVDIVEVAGGHVADDQGWPAINANYLITGHVTVDALLLIAPGVRLVFAQDVGMTVSSAGQLSAIGTAEAPVVLTGAEAIRGFWDGVYFDQTNSAANIIDHATIEYGGGENDANLVLYGTSGSPTRLTLTNTTLQHSGEYGLYINDHVLIEDFAANELTGNTSGAAYLAAGVAGYLDADSTYTGNDVDVVELWNDQVEAEQVWAAIDADYLISGHITVDALLTISPGARLVFAQDVGMTVSSDGRLFAIGTASEPIVLTGDESVQGYWDGLYFDQSNSPDNTLELVTIEYGGGENDGNLVLYGTSSSPLQITVTSCTFAESAEWGVYLNDNVNVNGDLAEVNTFVNNASGDVGQP